MCYGATVTIQSEWYSTERVCSSAGHVEETKDNPNRLKSQTWLCRSPWAEPHCRCPYCGWLDISMTPLTAHNNCLFSFSHSLLSITPNLLSPTCCSAVHWIICGFLCNRLLFKSWFIVGSECRGKCQHMAAMFLQHHFCHHQTYGFAIQVSVLSTLSFLTLTQPCNSSLHPVCC